MTSALDVSAQKGCGAPIALLAGMAWLDDRTRRRPAWGAALLALVALTSGCGQAAPTAPTSVAPAPSPPPAVTGPVTLTGQVTEAPPTTLTEIANAVVSVNDGVNAGKSTRTNDSGLFMLAGLSPGPTTITVTAENYVGASRVLDLRSATTSDFQLMPVPKTEANTIAGDIAAGDGTCSDGTAPYPCRIVVIPIHNTGPVDATLEWTGSGARLAVTLFQTGAATPIARSVSSGANQEHISATLPGGEDYEFRITLASGGGSATYTIRVTHMS